jgi:hypothetical protein
MRNISIHRHRDSAITKKAKWYLYARNEMASLIDNLDKLISGLCDLFTSDAGVRANSAKKKRASFSIRIPWTQNQ